MVMVMGRRHVVVVVTVSRGRCRRGGHDTDGGQHENQLFHLRFLFPYTPQQGRRAPI
jgi:hypothetical protein